MIFCIEKDGIQERVSSEEWERLTGVVFTTQLDFESPKIRSKILKKTEKLYKKGELSRQQLWFGSYFKTELESGLVPELVIRYIDSVFGWGVFAGRNFKKMEFIAEYSGVLRKSRRSDKTNAYCFEYTLVAGVKTPFTIDAQDRGGIARYINHSSKNPNVLSALATKDGISHVILITSKEVLKGTQLCYDYGSDYWSRREAPQ